MHFISDVKSHHVWFRVADPYSFHPDPDPAS